MYNSIPYWIFLKRAFQKQYCFWKTLFRNNTQSTQSSLINWPVIYLMDCIIHPHALGPSCLLYLHFHWKYFYSPKCFTRLLKHIETNKTKLTFSFIFHFYLQSSNHYNCSRKMKARLERGTYLILLSSFNNHWLVDPWIPVHIWWSPLHNTRACFMLCFLKFHHSRWQNNGYSLGWILRLEQCKVGLVPFLSDRKLKIDLKPLHVIVLCICFRECC